MAEKQTDKIEATKAVETVENKVAGKGEQGAETVKKENLKVSKKDEAVARGVSLPISKKHSMAICRFIKGKTIDEAIADLERVAILKKVVPFKGEIPHRHGNIMSGRYPVNASKAFISVLKGLRGNVAVNGMAVDKAKIYFGSASWASRPNKAGGARFKRTHIVLKAREQEVKAGKQGNKK